MQENTRILNRLQIAQGFTPGTLTTNTAKAVSLAQYRRCLILFHSAVAVAAQDAITLTVLQGTNVAFATNKALTFTDIWTKEGTDIGAVGQWTHITQAAANTFTDSSAAAIEKMWALEFMAEQLDMQNNYSCIRAAIGDVGSHAQVGSLIYILADPYFSKKPEEMASALID